MKRTVSFEKGAVNLFFHILTSCNLSCRHCYINPAQHGSKMLDIETIKEWLLLFSQNAEKTNLVLLGGEPTLHPDLSEAVRFAKKKGFASVTVDTNGFLFFDFLDRITPPDLDMISFSLDGATPSTNDKIRGKGTWKRTVEGIKEAVEKRFSVSVIFTVSRINMAELHLMPDLLASFGVGTFFIQVIGIRGRSTESGQESWQVKKEEWEALVPGVARSAALKNITAVYPRVFLEKDEPFECAGLAAENYFVFPNGRIYRCPLCEDYPIHSKAIESGRLVDRPSINESDLFILDIPEGCVMNRIIQPGNVAYDSSGKPEYRIACCMLKEKVMPLASPLRQDV